MSSSSHCDKSCTSMVRRSLRRKKQKGVTTVEVALLLPFLFTFIFALIEFGHAVMVENLLNSSCRVAARYGSTEGVTSQQIQDRISSLLSAAINPATVSQIVKDAGVYDVGDTLPDSPNDFEGMPDMEVADAEAGDLFLVRVSVPYNSISLLHLPFMNDLVLTGQAFTRHE